jgi:drug/metabolite transporter (DMT)-like permease
MAETRFIAAAAGHLWNIHRVWCYDMSLDELGEMHRGFHCPLGPVARNFACRFRFVPVRYPRPARSTWMTARTLGSEDVRAPPMDRVTLAAFLVAVLMLGANWVGVRFSNRELPPFFGAALRFAVAAAVLFAIIALRSIAIPRGRALAGATLFGVGQYFATFALIYWALVAVPAGMTSVVFATLPLWTLFLAAAAGQERLRTMNIAGALVAIGGLAVIFSDQLTASVPLERVAAVVGAAFMGGVVGVTVKAFPRTHPVATNAVGTLVGTLLLLVASLGVGERWALPQQGATWLALGYLVLSTVIGFVLLTWVILRWTPSAAAYGAVLGPVVTVVLATILAGEMFGPGFFVGALIVGAGVYVGAFASAQRSAPPRPAVTAAD